MYRFQTERKITKIMLRARAQFREKCVKIDTLIVKVDPKWCKSPNYVVLLLVRCGISSAPIFFLTPYYRRRWVRRF